MHNFNLLGNLSVVVKLAPFIVAILLQNRRSAIIVVPKEQILWNIISSGTNIMIFIPDGIKVIEYFVLLELLL